MRELRFRAFNAEKQMSEPFSLKNIIDYGLVMQNLGAQIFKLQDCEVMQFTGLTDCNEVEIYEGDILRWYINDQTRQAKVVFLDGAFWMENIWNDWLRGEYEVIGNVHQNPELIHDKD